METVGILYTAGRILGIFTPYEKETDKNQTSGWLWPDDADNFYGLLQRTLLSTHTG